MNKEQLKQKFDRFCRWQQEAPHYVNRHEGAPRRCHNCGTEFSDNFCPRCGQRAEVGRVGWNSIKENVALLWGMDSRSFIYTLFQLLTRPGYPRHTLSEGFFLQVFLSTLSLLLAFLDYFNENVIATIYIVIAYHQLFGYNWWGTLWRCVATALSAMLTMIPFCFVILLLFDTNFEDYLWVLAASIVSIVVILVASYYISRYQSKKATE